MMVDDCNLNEVIGRGRMTDNLVIKLSFSLWTLNSGMIPHVL